MALASLLHARGQCVFAGDASKAQLSSKLKIKFHLVLTNEIAGEIIPNINQQKLSGSRILFLNYYEIQNSTTKVLTPRAEKELESQAACL